MRKKNRQQQAQDVLNRANSIREELKPETITVIETSDFEAVLYLFGECYTPEDFDAAAADVLRIES